MKVLVVGSGAGGAMAARHLASAGAQVRVLEAGQPFQALTRRVRHIAPLRRVGLLGGEGTISRIFPHMRIARCGELVTVRGIGAGGCTTLSCGNMVRTDRGLKEMGLDLSAEFNEIESMLPICTIPRERWRPTTREMFELAEGMNLSPQATPKAMGPRRCADCGMCELGCRSGARWDSRSWVDEACVNGASISYGHLVKNIVVEGGRTVGVTAVTAEGERTIKADQVVLAAGGIGTAQVLLGSNIAVNDGLWVDPVITLGGIKPGSRQLDETPMAWFCRKEHYMIAPYMDLLSHFFQPSWRKGGSNDRVGVMVKLADTANGKLDADGNVFKRLTAEDHARIDEAMELVQGIMSGAGVKGPFVQGMINGGHLGGTYPLKREHVQGMRPLSLPEGLWLADLSLVPCSQGMPTMMLAAAIGLRVGRTIAQLNERT